PQDRTNAGPVTTTGSSPLSWLRLPSHSVRAPAAGVCDAAPRHGKHGVHAPLFESRDVHDSRACVLLRRPRRPEERAGDHDAELRLDGLDDGDLVRLRLLALLLG